ncbi:MAG: adenylosuccinate synthase [Holophagales bacterium]|jgi:adenylosuccinate synthase|nr:adenylosuccinate synthase [Holophagales bacterium]
MSKPAENIAILGLQWGDEGKGKLVDLLSTNFRNVVRFQGGNNAGHTVVINGESIALHQIPCGAHHPECFLIIGSGTVLSFEVFHQELECLHKRGIDILDRLLLSDKAHIILPYHIAIDNWRESGSVAIGTTGRGIGPTYEAKAARHGVRLGDIKAANLLEKISIVYKEACLKIGSSASLPTPETVFEKLRELASPLLKCIGNAQEYLYNAWKQGESILFEGAQATMLDIDHGTYPFVTSSNCSIGGLFIGTGLPPKALNKVIGVAKAYTTRVGAGPFPSELNNSIGEQIRKAGHEFGTTTGRPRRCGWLDAIALRYACHVNGVDALGIMKLDVLDDLERIGIVNGYQTEDGKLLHTPPSSAQEWEKLEPVIEYFDGWTKPTKGAKSWSSLPTQAQKYLKAIEKIAETPIAYISTGPDREEGLFT